jgi:hypothetical protein
MNRKSRVAVIVCLAAFALMLMAAPALAQPTDIKGHWAEQTVGEWIYNGYIDGYLDGSFRPDNSITRAEFMVLVNRAFGFTEQAAISFSDVSAADWFYGDAAIAIAAGYISGYEDGTLLPGAQISRQEAAVIIARLLKLDGAPSLIAISDSADITQWSSGHVGAVLENGIMRGYPDQTFRPFNPLSRAEAVVVLDAALAARVVPPVVVPPVVVPPVVAPVISVSGGGGGGGGGYAELKVVAATLTVDGKKYDVAVTGGNEGEISLAALNTMLVLSEGRISVSKKSTLDLTIPIETFGTKYGLSVTQSLEKGWNTLKVVKYLGDLYPDGGLTLAKTREVLGGSDVTFEGTLTDANDITKTIDVSLVVTLP